MNFKQNMLTILYRIRGLFLSIYVPDVCLCCDCILYDTNTNIVLKKKHYQHNNVLLKQMFFCDVCEEKVNKHLITNECCKKCGYPIKKENFLDNNKQCQSCKEYKPVFNVARSCYCYKGAIRKMLLNFKFYSFNGCLWFFGKAMYEVYKNQLKTADYVCFVPITKKKLFLKGFNHACELAKIFCKVAHSNYHDIVLLYDFIIKATATKSSKTLTQHDRLLKKHCFKINDKYLHKNTNDYIDFNSKTILVVDDIMTTGGTLNAMAKTIKQHFPRCKVECLTFARTMLW